MMLGLISFFVNVLESSGLFELYFSAFKEADERNETDHTIAHRRVVVFELVHIALFVLSIFYVIICIVSFWICQRTWKKWGEYEKKGESEVFRENSKLQEQWSRLGWKKIFSLKLFWKLWKSNDEVSYFHSRTRFILVNNLEYEFRYDVYLRHQLQSLFLLLIEISWKLWIGILAISLFNWVRIKYEYDPHSAERLMKGGHVWLFILGFGYGIMVISTLIYFFIQGSFSIYLRRISKKNSYLKVNGNILNLILDSEIQQKLLTYTEKDAQEIMKPTVSYIDVKNHHFLRSPYLTFTLLQLCLLAQSVSLFFSSKVLFSDFMYTL